ncbi:RNA polymerase sigma factor, sigma-70 family [Hathewaya proteolytica DSM 3090]|uniref:RNA polymerase sigma factor, sigma-70 family n=1 Tax=Hathewaya proteolytica DSM 3090 TaxID=1121331 RepID=A0A1M6RI50_9CLOT|nr:RNA polymerase sigma factor, sigma-70 family [Hathewaya proteolytica DSM 3090]
MDGIEVTSPSAESEGISNLSRIEIIKQLHEIKEPMREIMYLRMFGNLSFKEIGDILGKTENWARVNYYRGKEKLLKEMKNNE